ncbi:hypothetical protein Bbelb_414010, partial [Branchiostoma belcheri]
MAEKQLPAGWCIPHRTVRRAEVDQASAGSVALPTAEASCSTRSVLATGMSAPIDFFASRFCATHPTYRARHPRPRESPSKQPSPQMHGSLAYAPSVWIFIIICVEGKTKDAHEERAVSSRSLLRTANGICAQAQCGVTLLLWAMGRNNVKRKAYSSVVMKAISYLTLTPSKWHTSCGVNLRLDLRRLRVRLSWSSLVSGPGGGLLFFPPFASIFPFSRIIQTSLSFQMPPGKIYGAPNPTVDRA